MLEERVTHLEREMPEARRDAGDARRLASAAHEEVGSALAKLNAHTKLLNGLRDTQLEHRTEIRSDMHNLRVDIHQEFGKVWTELGNLRTEMRNGFAMVGIGMAEITALLNVAIKKDEAD